LTREELIKLEVKVKNLESAHLLLAGNDTVPISM